MYRVSKKDARFLKWKSISDLLIDQREGQIKEDIGFEYICNQAPFIEHSVGSQLLF